MDGQEGGWDAVREGLMACEYGNREIYGIIFDAETEAPITGARVRIGAIDGQCVPGTPDQRTGPKGEYSTTIAGPGGGDGRYVFQITLEGYEQCTGVEVGFPHPHGDKVHRSFALRRA
jgi:hypothetical protein